MARVIDITDKLNFEEKPSIKIKDTVLKINDDAPSMLKILAILNDENGVKPDGIEKLVKLLFEPSEREKLSALDLNIRDYTMAVMQTAKVVSNFDDNEGEAPTPATI